MVPGNGAQKFREWMAAWIAKDKANTKKSLAERLRCSPAALYQWADGYTTPMMPARVDIERVTDGAVTVDDWGPENDRRKAEPAA